MAEQYGYWKPGITFGAAPDFLEQNVQAFGPEVLVKYPPPVLTNDEPFCRGGGGNQGELLVIHPFRKGNARTIKMMTNLLAVQPAGRCSFTIPRKTGSGATSRRPRPPSGRTTRR